MIPTAAISAFLRAPRDDIRWIRDLTDAELDEVASALPARPPIWGKLQRDQRVSFVAGAIHRRLGLWLDCGLGKTMISIALARYFDAAGIARRHLVLVPSNINLAEWEVERDKHSPDTTMTVLSGSSAQKWERLRSSASLLTVATYGGLVRMVCRKTTRTKGRRAGETVLEIHRPLLEELARTFDGIFMDESSADQAVQYQSSLAFRVCRRISRDAKCAFALSGTPFGKDPTPLWAQMYLVDRGESLGETIGLFRAAFFREEKNYWGGADYVFREQMAPEVSRLIAHRSLTIEADQSSLPPVVEQVRAITLPHEADSYSERAREAVQAARGNYQETKSAFVRLRQISSGFLGYTDDETGARAKFAFDENPKLESLIAKLQSVVGKYKAVVFHEFIYSGDMICRELERLEIGHARISAVSREAIQRERARFVEDDDCRVLVISNRLSQGPNLQIAKYCEFFESPVDPKTRKQARRRVERQHSEHDRVFITDYVARGTFDQKILDHLARGQNLFDAIIRGEEL
ncbi:DEAD/DEAH box helicase [bacterium]|nr:DEAD/DEAH box helicase [bacterium]